jgi:hypothetical protein
MKNLLRAILRMLATKPCACGKRPHGDRQELVKDLDIEPGRNWLTGKSFIRVAAGFRCLVCKQVHTGCLLVKDQDHLLRLMDGKFPLEVIDGQTV